MKTIALLFLLIAGTFCTTTLEKQLVRDLFSQWKLTHNKAYKTGHEDEHRFNIFLQNYLYIQAHNQKNSGVTLALNLFADLTSEEFGASYTGFTRQNKTNAQAANFELKDPPSTVDWISKGAVTPIRNQLSCASCWAFSAVGALEGLNFIKTGKLESFSEQNLVDCVTTVWGCEGGYMTESFIYTAANGIEKRADYPYVAKTQKCSFNASKAVKINTGYVIITERNVTALKSAIANQPVSVGIQANQRIFQFYRGGVITNGCGDNLDHGVLAVGYGKFNNVEAYIIKNSWGTNWGVAGWAMISTDPSQNNGNGVCGILLENCIPTVK